MRRSTGNRRGIALLDVIVGGVLLGMGLSVVLSLSGRSLARQTDGEKQMTAAWLVDELLSMVVVEGPVTFPQVHDTHGTFEPPFDDFEFEVEIDDTGLNEPMLVTATVWWPHHSGRRSASVQTRITERLTDEPFEQRAPLEPIDRLGRWYDDEEE